MIPSQIGHVIANGTTTNRWLTSHCSLALQVTTLANHQDGTFAFASTMTNCVSRLPQLASFAWFSPLLVSALQGNKNSGELWANVYKLQERELLAFNDEVTEKVRARTSAPQAQHAGIFAGANGRARQPGRQGHEEVRGGLQNKYRRKSDEARRRALDGVCQQEGCARQLRSCTVLSFASAGVVGRDECRNIIKDALKEGITHLPQVLVQYSEIDVMRKLADKTVKLMTGAVS